MISASHLLLLLVLVPLAGAAATFACARWRPLLALPAVSSFCVLTTSVFVLRAVRVHGRVMALGNNLFADGLSVYHVCLVGLVFSLTALYAFGYFRHEIQRGLAVARVKRFAALMQVFLATLMMVLLSNNMGLLWVSLEATTLASAFLILTEGQPSSIEAMWKYLMICSVGILFAFVGVLLLSVASRGVLDAGEQTMLWTVLSDHAGRFNPKIMLAAFIFALVGYGTKAGLAPMHTWLPDAHSQAPSPVSAVFSGVMLNCALYCVLRYLPLTEASLGFSGEARGLLLILGLVSMIVAAVFIPSQTDVKRLLAYHSVEHMGIIAVGIGVGGFATVAALFHTLNHSLSKTLAFFSAGKLTQDCGTRDMRRMHGALKRSPLWGFAFLVSVLVLVGVAPFSVFMSELQLVIAAFEHGRYVSLGIFLVSAAVIFVTALRHAMDVGFGKTDSAPLCAARVKPVEIGIVAFVIALLLGLGIFIPTQYGHLLQAAAGIVEGVR